MQEKYLENYLGAFTSVLTSFLGEESQYNINKIQRNLDEHQDISIVLGFVGDYKGQVHFAMQKPVALALSSILAGGMELTEVDEIVKSAMGELCNMIMGNTCTLFAEQKISMDITPPSIITGDDFVISNLAPTFCHDISIENMGTVRLDVTIKEEKQRSDSLAM